MFARRQYAKIVQVDMQLHTDCICIAAGVTHVLLSHMQLHIDCICIAAGVTCVLCSHTVVAG